MSRRRPGRARGAPLLRGCPNASVLGIGQWRPIDRPPLFQSCRDNTPCAHAQPLYVLVRDRLWVHGGRVWIGRCRGGARFFPFPCARPNVLGIQPWSSNDRPPWLQSCRENNPCTHDQTINEHVCDMLWGHGGQGKSGRRPGEGWRPFAVPKRTCPDLAGREFWISCLGLLPRFGQVTSSETRMIRGKS